MATFEELMKQARAAYAAGDVESAKALGTQAKAERDKKPGFSAPLAAIPVDQPTPTPPTDQQGPSGFTEQLAALMQPPAPQAAVSPVQPADPFAAIASSMAGPSVPQVAANLDQYFPGSGYADVMRGGPRMPPQAVAQPVQPADPFAGESFGDLAARRGQQFAIGAAEVGASVPEALAIAERDILTSRLASVEAAIPAVADERAQLESIIQQYGPAAQSGDWEANARVNAANMRLANIAGQEAMIGRMAADDRAAASVPVSETPLFKAGDATRKAVEGFVGKPDSRDTGFWSQVAQGAGNMTGMVAVSAVGGLAGGPVGALATGAASGSAMSAPSLYKEAIEAGATEDVAVQAARWGALIGASEIVPITRALKILPPRLRGELTTGMMRKFVDIAQSAGEEAAQEYLATVANNITAQQLFDGQRGWTEGATDAALVGAVLGGGVGAAGSALEGRGATRPPRDREDQGQPAAQPPAINQIAATMQPPPAPDQAPKVPQPAQPGPQTQQTQQPADPLAQIVAAMTGQAPQSGQSGQTITRAEAEADPDRFEIVDEAEGQGANWRPTGAQVVIDKATGQAIPLAPDTAAANPAANAATEIAPDGFKLVHGGKSGLTLDAIEIIRTGQKQAKNGKKLGGFYAASEADADYAESYAGMVDGGTTYDVVIKPGTKILRKDGDITRLSEKQIADWLSQGIGIVVGKDPRGKTEYAVIDKNAIQSLDLRRLPSPPSSSGTIQPNDQGNQAIGQAPEADVVAASGGVTPPAPAPNQPRNFEFVDAAGVQNIQTEPGVMQYKAGGDAEGVTDRLKGVTEWRPERAGMSIIYEYADGRRVIADGHQRLGLAKRLAGQGKAIQMPAMILRQADGVTPEEARVSAALKNIAEGSGTALDAAKVLRGTDKTPAQLDLPPNSAIVRDAVGMRSLSDQAFGMVVNGVSSERDGGIVGRVVTDKAAQANILGLLARMQKDRPITAFQAEQVAKQAAADTVTETQDSLFGPETDTKNLYLERAKILEAANRMTRDEAKAFKNVVVNAERLQAAGNQLDANGNKARVDNATTISDYLGREANTKGAISEALTAAARALNGGATIAGATRQFLDAVERELGARGGERPSGDQGGQSAGSNRPQEPEPQSVDPDARDDNAANGDLFGGPVAAQAPNPQADILAAMTGQVAPKPEPAGDLFGITPQTGKTPEQIRAEAEAEARKNQSKLRKTGGNDGDAGPLFDGQGDMLGAQPSTPRPTETGLDLIQKGRVILQRYSGDSDALFNQNAGTDLRATSQGLKMADNLLAAKTMAAKQKVADDFVLMQGRATGDEHLVVLDETGVPLAIMRGWPASVSAHAEVYRAADAGIVGHATHNHPRSSSHSGPDVAMLFAGFSPLTVMGHDGTSHTIEVAPGASMNWEGKTSKGIAQTTSLGEAFSQIRFRTDTITNAAVNAMADVPRDEKPSHWDRINAPLFPAILDRMGIVLYSDSRAVEKVEALGINFGDIYGQVSGYGFDALRRAGLVVPEGGSASGNRPAGSSPDAAPPGTDSADQEPAGNAGPRASVTPASTGNADIDGALDDLFGDDNDVPSTGTDLERPGRDGTSTDGVGTGNVPATPGRSGRGTRRGGGKAASGNGKRSSASRIPDGDAPSVGGGSNPGADGSGGADSQPAASGNGGSGNGGRGGRLSSDTGGKGNAAGNASGSTGKLTAAQQLAAIRGILKEDVLDFVSGPERRSTDTDAFRKWFGDSKVVDADGDPIVLWHGTARRLWDQDFGAFQGMVWASEGSLLPMDYAAMRANRIGEDQAQERLIDLYMRVERPFDADLGLSKTVTVGDMITAMIEQAEAQGRRLSDGDMAALRNKSDVINRARRREESGPHYSRHDFWYQPSDYFGRDGAQAILEAFRITGFDGIKMLEGGEQTWGAFDPKQVKSPQNQGTWDAGSPYMLREDPATGIDPRKAEALESIFVGALDGVNPAQYTDRQIFASIILPLKDAGMTRAEVAELSPYLTGFLADLRAGRVNLDQEPTPATKPIEADDRATKQAEADKIKVKPVDRANIDATLPLLLPEQRDDVFKVETRFAKPDGHGMMITNGTGTGKTFSGGGVIKRFYQGGKKNVLIIAPSDAVIAGWTRALDALSVPVSQLAGTNDAGRGVVITTYANLRANDTLASRDWDLVVTDEAQNLMSNATGDATGYLQNLRAITKRPQDFWHLVRMKHADEIARLWPKSEEKVMRRASDAVEAARRALDDKMRKEVEALHRNPPPRSKVLFLSATPFAYDKTVDYAEGYLFDYPEDGRINGSNQSGRNLFMVQNFGYRIRYHKLTKPEHAVDSAVFERDFHEKMKRDGVLSGRSLQVDVDYDRRFVKKDDADGTRLDEALEALDELAAKERDADHAEVKAGRVGRKDQPFNALQNHMRKNFDYLARQQLLEAIKARLAVDEIKAHLALGRKVVVFHDFNVGGGLNPFTHLKTQVVGVDEATGEEIRQPISPMTAEASEGYRKLLEAHPWIRDLNFAGYKPPIKHLPEALGKTVRLFNGNVPTKQRLQNLADFNTDGSGADVLVVQADAGGAGISMHDVTKGHQRALINLGMPTKPTTTLQQEGRILRVGSQSDAIFRYFTIGTGWERTAFAQRIAERSGTVENLALGDEARDMMNAFIDAYMDASDFAPSAEDGKGGKAKDSRTHTTTPFQRAVSHYFGRPKITGNRNQRDGIDFYPTAEPLAFKMVEWAGLRANERVLEPSAGDGAIVRYMPDDVALTFVEPSADLRSTAQLRAPKGDAKETTFEQHHISNKYHVIVMNPPFGSGGSTAIQHLAKAAKHLRAGGRIVALIPTGPSADKKFETWWHSDEAADFNWTADISLPSAAFERAGTGVMTRVVILDKITDLSERARFGGSNGGTKRLNFTGAQNITEFFDRLEQYGIPDRPAPKQDVVEELEAEGQDATTPADTRRPGPPLATEIGSFEKTTVTSKKGKVFPAAHHAAKVERDVYDQMKTAATALDGWWHRNDTAPKGSGPTFAFRTEAARDAFLADMQKPTAPGGFEETASMFREQRAQMVREAFTATEEITRLMPSLRAELDRLDLKRVKLTRADSATWQGAFVVTGDGEMEIVIGASLDPVKTLHHEVIHALRAMDLFTPEEWKALSLAAERKWLAKHDIAARYPHLTEEERIEEAIAEEFSEALAAKQAPNGSILIRAFNKIARILRAFRNVLAGMGYQTPDEIFGRVLAGEVSARQAGNTGAQVSFQRKGRDTDTGDLFAQPEPAKPSGMTADQRRELEARQKQSKMRKTGGNSGDAGPLFNDDKDLFGQRTMFQRQPLAVRPLTPQARAHRNSAMGATPFIPDRRVWESLTRAGIPIWQRLRDLPGAASDAVDRARYVIQDRMLPFLRAQEAVMMQTGRPLPKEHDAYLQETTFSGKVGRHLLEIDEEYTKPIIQIIAKSKGKITADSVGEWLYARHAIERNAYIASINPNMPDGGSGMESIDAAQILADVAASPEAAQYDQIGAMIDALRERNLKLREDSGLISSADANLWRAQYKHYVPLKGFEETDHYESMMDLGGVKTGRRFSIRGQEAKRALGRQSEAFNPLQSAITQAQEVAIRAEKNRVAQSMFDLAANHPSKALWEVKRPKQKRYFNRTTGLVEMRVENPVTMVLEPNEMAVKIDGKEHRILFNDQRLAEAAGTLGADQMGAALRVLSIFSRFFSMTRTMLNPEFMITNAFRDFQTAQFNIQAFGEQDKARIAKAMAKNWRKAFMGAMRGSTYRFDTEWSRYYKEFQKAGAQVWFWTMEQPEAARGDLEKRIELARGTKAQRALKVMTTPSAFFSFRDNAALNFIERTNLAVDNAIRLAAFVEARRAGWDVGKAAFLAKELTVNFNRRGEAGAQMNALYPFFNAAIQGTVRTVKAISSRRVALMVLTAFAAGALNDMLNAALSDEDEDGELFYDKVADFRNERNFHMVLWGTGDNPFSIPMPYGYNIFPYAGQQLGKVIRGVKDPDEAFADVARAAFGAFSPISAATPAQMISPVLSDPIVEMAENKNWLGTPIYPQDYGNQTEPDAFVHFRGATAASKWVAQTINGLTGGDMREPGAVDVSPETLDHLASFVTGSAGAFWGRSFDMVAKSLQGDFESIEQRSIPFVRNLTSPVGDWSDRDRFYRFSADVKNAQADKKAYEAAGMPVPKKTNDLAALYPAYLAANREMSGKGEWNASKAGSLAARAQNKVWLDFNGKYLRVMGKQGE